MWNKGQEVYSIYSYSEGLLNIARILRFCLALSVFLYLLLLFRLLALRLSSRVRPFSSSVVSFLALSRCLALFSLFFYLYFSSRVRPFSSTVVSFLNPSRYLAFASFFFNFFSFSFFWSSVAFLLVVFLLVDFFLSLVDCSI